MPFLSNFFLLYHMIKLTKTVQLLHLYLFKLSQFPMSYLKNSMF